MEKAVNVLTAFVSVILSVLFIIIAIASPLFYSVAGMIQPKTITNVIQNVDYVEILKDSDDFNQKCEELGIDMNTADEIIKSESVGDFIEDCASELTLIIGNSDDSLEKFNASTVKNLLDEHIDGILDVFEEKTGESVDRNKIKSELDVTVEENKEAIEDIVVALEPVQNTITEYSEISGMVKKALGWQCILILIVIQTALLALIYVLRRKNYKGFIWIAVNTGIVGVVMLTASVLLNSRFAKEIIAQTEGFASEITASLINSAAAKLLTALVVCFVIMALSITACVLLRKYKKSIKTADAESLN